MIRYFYIFTLLLSFNSLAQPGSECIDSLVFLDTLSLNRDGIDEEFKVDLICPPEKYSIEIRDEGGTLMFWSKDPIYGWYGLNTQEEDVDEGRYIFDLELTYNGVLYSLKGDIILTR